MSITKAETAALREVGHPLLYHNRNKLLDKVDSLIESNEALRAENKKLREGLNA